MSNDIDTKTKILEVANLLFAKHGFGSTSIRDIANEANVNLSAINYHFKNKENLYWKVFDYNYEKTSEQILNFSETTSSIEELSMAVFGLFLEDGAATMNMFKIFLSDIGGVPEEGLSLDKRPRLGPPGQDVFLNKLRLESPKTVSDDMLETCVNMIFSILCHLSLLMNTQLVKSHYKEKDEFKVDKVKKEVLWSVRAHLAALKN
jgi:hypothetical protein